MLHKIGSPYVFRDGVNIDCSGRLPHQTEQLAGVKEIRVTPDGTIERYSESDWAWKPAPELQDFIATLNSACDAVVSLQLQKRAVELAALAVRQQSAMPVTGA